METSQNPVNSKWLGSLLCSRVCLDTGIAIVHFLQRFPPFQQHMIISEAQSQDKTVLFTSDWLFHDEPRESSFIIRPNVTCYWTFIYLFLFCWHKRTKAPLSSGSFIICSFSLALWDSFQLQMHLKSFVSKFGILRNIIRRAIWLKAQENTLEPAARFLLKL